MGNQIIYQCSGQIYNKPASVTVDHMLIKFTSKNLNKAMPIKQISGCNIIKYWDDGILRFGMVTCFIALAIFSSVSKLVGLALIILAGAVVIWLGKRTYVEINSSSDKIIFFVDKNYNPQEFINAIQTAMHHE